MTMRRNPPPPPPRRIRPGRWEAAVLEDWDRRIPSYARRVWHPERLGLTRDDVVQELRLALVLACRAYAKDSPERPSDAFISTVLRNTATSIVRLTRAQKRAITNEDGFLQGAEEYLEGVHEGVSPLPDPEQAVAQVQEEDGFRGLVYLLREHLSPATFAVLHLRFAEEWEPEVMTTLLGHAAREEWVCRSCGCKTFDKERPCCSEPDKQHQEPAGVSVATQRMSQVLARAKVQALDYLASLGVYSYDDAQVSMEATDDHEAESG